MSGGAGNDLLVGVDSELDRLNGGAGNDTLTGGTNGDDFVFDQTAGAADADVITDFGSGGTGLDALHLDARVMPALGTTGQFAPNDARFYAAAGATGGNDADDRVIYDISTGKLYYDADGNGSGIGQLIATVQGAPVAATNIFVDNGTASSGQNIQGTTGNDSLTGSDGNDTIDGGAGNDTMNGGAGNDTYVVDSAGDVLIDSSGIDTVMTSVNWNLGLDFENLTMTGTADLQGQGNNLDNFAIGNSGNNYFNMRAGSDTIQAGAGNDTIDMSRGGTASYGNDSVDGGPGIDTVDFAGYASSGLIADLGAGTVTGGGDGGVGSATLVSIERFVGGGFNDRITGSSVANYLNGAEGDDTLNGLAGVDTLTGSVGADSFVFNQAPGAADADQIADFASGVDKIRLDGSVMPALGPSGNFTATDGRFYAAPGAIAGHDVDDRVVYDTSTANLYYDPDGSGPAAAQLVATLSGAPSLTATDITVI
jgi:Ca2+-binding RTX toxin-like protein